MADWTTTIRQVLPRLLSVSRHLRPTLHLDSVAELTPEFLRARGIRTVIWDVDGTLMPWHARDVEPALAPAFEALLRAEGVRHVILSNCSDERLAELGRLFPGVPVLKGYDTPEGRRCRRLLGGVDGWTDARDAPSPAEARPIRKPDAALVAFALEEAGETEARRAAMVGDQYMTDIAGANLAGVQSIKVRTVARSTFPFAVRWFQRIEEVWQRLLAGRGAPSG
ncbi:MAG: YqeG family HAD IIIA-type phosphatase [Gemmatimonadota bacterium]